MTVKPKSELPTSLTRVSDGEPSQAADFDRSSDLEDARFGKSSDFRLDASNPEAGSRATRLRSAVRQAGGNKAVSAASGVPTSTLHAYLNGQDWKVSAAVALAEACRVPLEWLLTGNGTDESSAFANTEPLVAQLPAPADKYIMIPRYDVRASAGPGTQVDQEEMLGLISFDEMFLRRQLGTRPEALVTLEATGDSMSPTIRDGDLLLVDTSNNEIQDGRIYVLSIDGFLSVKRLQIQVGGAIAVISDNERYAPQIIAPTEHNPLRIVGRVVYQAGPVRS